MIRKYCCNFVQNVSLDSKFQSLNTLGLLAQNEGEFGANQEELCYTKRNGLFDKEFRCEELPELVVLGQPGKGWKEVTDEPLP